MKVCRLVPAIVAMLLPGIAAAQWVQVQSPTYIHKSLPRGGVSLADGRVLLAGANDFSGRMKKVEIFDSASGQWSTVADMREQVSHTMVRLADGRVIALAGCDPIYCVDSNTADIYDPATDAWSRAAFFAGRRTAPAAVTLNDGRVLMVGGAAVKFGRQVPANPQAELYDPATNTWSPTGSMNAARLFVTATLLSDGQVLVIGGGSGGSTEIYNPASNAWSPSGSLNVPRAGHAAVLLSDGRVLVAGGFGDGRHSAEIFDPATQSWSLAANMATPRTDGHSGTLLVDGRVLVAGGRDSVGRILRQDSAELYDPVTNTWVEVGPMTDRRSGHFAALLPSGRVFAVGAGESPRSAEVSPLF